MHDDTMMKFNLEKKDIRMMIMMMKMTTKTKHKWLNEPSLDDTTRLPFCRQQKSVGGYYCLGDCWPIKLHITRPRQI